MTDPHLQTEVALLKQDVMTNREMLNKATSTIDKIGEVASYVAKILAVHDERLENNEQAHVQMQIDFKDTNLKIEQVKIDLAEDIERTEARLTTSLEEIKKLVGDSKTANNTKFEEYDARIRTLENWRWLLVGGGLVLGVLLGNTHILSQIFKLVSPGV